MRGTISRDSKAYPEIFNMFMGMPDKIYYEGDIGLLKSRCIAIVGSRKCTQYGKTVAKTIGRRIAESGVTVVSGLAKGIDTCGHKGALEVNGKTIAVLGCGIDQCYPAENKLLKEEICKTGLVISEYPPGFAPKPYTFPQRNRIISALSESVVIVEAGNKSGALITAQLAAEQGKNLYAVPGNITSHYSFGTNKLIRENVTPLILIDDILIDLGITPYIKEEMYGIMGEDEKIIFDLIKKTGEMTIDEIYHETNIFPSTISGIITILEMKGLIFSSLGKVFVAKF